MLLKWKEDKVGWSFTLAELSLLGPVGDVKILAFTPRQPLEEAGDLLLH